MERTPFTRFAVISLLLSSAGFCVPGFAQLPQDSQMPSLPTPVPAPPPPDPTPDEEEGESYDTIIRASDAPWVLPDPLRKKLELKARIYHEVLRSFVADETVRRAEYKDGAVGKERVTSYGYVLVAEPGTDKTRESRREFDRKGQLKPEEVDDEEPFPPAYEWVLLFSRVNQTRFAYRHVGQRFDGFDVVHEIEFKGDLSFTDGRDIRQWEGRVLIDAFTFSPLEVEAQPTGQHERMQQLFDLYNRSFNIMGFRTGKKPNGYRATVDFGFRHTLRGPVPVRLTFPTRLRYDTHRAITPRRTTPIRASIRTYSNYQFTTTKISDSIYGEIREADGVE